MYSPCLKRDDGALVPGVFITLWSFEGPCRKAFPCSWSPHTVYWHIAQNEVNLTQHNKATSNGEWSLGTPFDRIVETREQWAAGGHGAGPCRAGLSSAVQGRAAYRKIQGSAGAGGWWQNQAVKRAFFGFISSHCPLIDHSNFIIMLSRIPFLLYSSILCLHV